MFKRVLLITLSIVFSIMFFKHAAHCDIKLLLQSRVVIENYNLTLKDVAVIEGNYYNIEKIGNIKIERDIYSDGYIDKKEILTLLKDYTEDSVYIFGNAVRVVHSDQLKNIYVNESSEFLLKKGDKVNIVVKKNGISVMLRGTIVNEAKIDEDVSVRLENKSNNLKVVKGKIKSKDLVEVNL